MKNIRRLLICLPFFSLPFLFSNLSYEEVKGERPFHDETTNAAFVMMADSLPQLYNELFAASGVCVKCHGYDTAGIASVNMSGADINVVDDWRSTMMANAARDPFWRAKVSHEVLLFPQHKQAIEDKCTACHAPLAHFNARHTGQPPYSMAELADDPMALDGVSCLACHQMSADSLGLSFSGEVRYDTFDVAYGPYENPLVSPMLTETGYRPYFSQHIEDAGICAGCHTLITGTIDYDGSVTGNQFVEQATYHEWLNSVYKDSVSCQNCHMPSLDKWPVRLVAGAQTEPRSPFYLHDLVGGNVTMLRLLRDNIDALGIPATEEQFDETIAKTTHLLQNRSILLQLDMTDRSPDTAFLEITLTNFAGHKFPSGYPSRRAFIELTAITEGGDTLFVSGKTDEDFEVIGQNPDFEPHYNVINSEDQVQIYEMVMGDVNGEVTTVLERADHPLKDNRLPPKGFTTTNVVYDTTLIAGKALTDTDFNKEENGQEGSGSDVVHYHIPLGGFTGFMQINATVYYQPTPPKWMKEMFDHSTPAIDTFRQMFAAADRSPVPVRSATLLAEAISASGQASSTTSFVRLFPIPSKDGRINIVSNQK
ncbi:MAG TPA: hypothetical protein ENJ20_07770, partial [Bacteroidetes bacterium]|nr:hypothetical protein [Bacteroidota bacterium]